MDCPCAWEFIAAIAINAAIASKNKPILRTMVSPLSGICDRDVRIACEDTAAPFVRVRYHRRLLTAREIRKIFPICQHIDGIPLRESRKACKCLAGTQTRFKIYIWRYRGA